MGVTNGLKGRWSFLGYGERDRETAKFEALLPKRQLSPPLQVRRAREKLGAIARHVRLHHVVNMVLHLYMNAVWSRQIIPHPRRPLGEYLEGVLWAQRHDR